MIQVKNLQFYVFDRFLFKNISFQIKSGQRIGLIGPNGAGKTTLLKALNNQLEGYKGKIIVPKNYKIGYLPQEQIHIDNESILKVVLNGRPDLTDMWNEITVLQKKLKEKQKKELIERLGKLGGYELDKQAEKLLSGLGFKEEDFIKDINIFSGGWRMRAYLARLLLAEPNLLLLDEPTNHLDLSSIEWLENYLKNFKGAIIVVSHDRFFLDRFVEQINELYDGRMNIYPGNYSNYEFQKEEMIAMALKKQARQKEEIIRVQRFIDRFRYKNTKARQVQSRIKVLEKIELEDVPQEINHQINFQIQTQVKSYKDVLKIEKMSFKYPDSYLLFNDLNLSLYRGDKIALVGENGTGKTTLTRLICKELQPSSGKIDLGERVITGYFAQHQTEALDLNSTVFEEVEKTAADAYHPFIRDILGVFRFSGEDTSKKISVLSGGEKARVSLAKILLSPCNFLIMDEPTNHLDIAARDALENSLRFYDGTLLIISHDRYFLDGLVNKVWELNGGFVKEYIGNYSEYMQKREIDEDESYLNAQRKKNKTAFINNTGSFKSKEQKRLEAEIRQVFSKERKTLEEQINQIELSLEKLTDEIKNTETEMANPETYKNSKKIAELTKKHKDMESQLLKLEDDWEEKQLALEQLILKIKVETGHETN